MAFNVTVHDSKRVHVLEDNGDVSGDFDPGFAIQLDLVLLDVQQVEQRVRHVLKHNVDVWNVRDHAHQDTDVWMPQNSLHHDFVLNFLQQLVCQPRVEDLLDCDRRTVELALVNYGESTLANFLSDLNVVKGDLSNSWNWRKSS